MQEHDAKLTHDARQDTALASFVLLLSFAETSTGERRIIEFLLSPLARRPQEPGRER